MLQAYWGFSELRPLQAEVIDAALAQRDAVVVMPTGGGKSLCFQLPAVVTESLTVVVSPLIALMKDQVDGLTLTGIPAAALNSSLSQQEETETKRRLAEGKLRLLYLSPERLLMPGTQRLLEEAKVARFAIDEAHCISEWGHDFRPEYQQLAQIKQRFPEVCVQAFTATATPKVRRDIAIQLQLQRPRLFVGVFDRPNLTYRILSKDDPVGLTVDAVRRFPDEGVIVYCLSRRDTEAMAAALAAQGIPAAAYHAGLPNETRKQISEDFAQERANVVVATVAFGMGIDRANVRCVIHECLPKSMEGYQQETGRAGRDGLPSECVLLYSHGDVERLKRLLADGETEVAAQNLRLLEDVRRFARSAQCRHKTLSEHFGQEYEVPSEGCGACDVCLGGLRPLPDSTRIARQILSTAANLLAKGRPFGVGLLAAVLTGSRAKNVTERKAELVDGFGAFAAEAAPRVTSWIHQLADEGLFAIAEGQYPTLSITEEGRRFIAGDGEMTIMENAALVPAPKRKGVDEPEGMDRVLFEKLRAWRRQVAAERGVPAYVIFHDSTLMRLAATRPSTMERLRPISGVGSSRAGEFGEALIGLIGEHCRDTGIALDQGDIQSVPMTPKPAVTKKSNYAAFFQAGRPIDEIAVQVGLKPVTIWQHLANWVASDRPESIDPWVSPDVQKKVRAALQEVDSPYLKPLYEALGGTVTYDQIRVVKAFATSLDSATSTP